MIEGNVMLDYPYSLIVYGGDGVAGHGDLRDLLVHSFE
jgi:hypothetical protein